MMASGWNDERIDRLRQAIADGWTSSQIMIALNREFPNDPPLTRSAVVGKASRLGLQIGLGKRSYGSRTKRKPLVVPPPKPAPRVNRGSAGWGGLKAAPRMPREPKPDMPIANRTDVVATCPWDEWSSDRCKFIPGDPRLDPSCCGKPVAAPGMSYCRECAAIVYDLRDTNTTRKLRKRLSKPGAREAPKIKEEAV